MKTLVAYASRHGTAEKIAHLLSLEIQDSQVRLLDLRHESATVNIDDFDQVIIGGSIHFGEIQKSVKEFYNQYHKQLMTKKLGLFLCFMRDEIAEEEFNNAYPEELQNHAKALGFFGGELLFEKMNFMERLVVSTVSKKTENEYHIDEEAVESFIWKMNH